MTFQPDKVPDFLANFDENKQAIRNFEGCTHLDLLQDLHQPNIYCTYSIWESEIYLNNYRNSALFRAVWTKTKAWFAEKPTAFSVLKAESV
jgi:quinol monooxygenase YgiN